ncbi:SlyX family protein [Psittacicella hinzii]|uniref:Protein SlyX homolog n=1 Tax=Psittacicella hinzii TaxID=2028575 RepID=A0A3A1YBA0_9GAMM|nr:SlyX family protein [Psittacicella hinzii]RIY34448.1 hypothetical protein CKF58_08155 [Psittacicella hinzii]
MTQDSTIFTLLETKSELEKRIQSLEEMVVQLLITVETLDTALINQQKEIFTLERKIKVISEYLKSQQNNVQIASQAEETPPPHY